MLGFELRIDHPFVWRQASNETLIDPVQHRQDLFAMLVFGGFEQTPVALVEVQQQGDHRLL